MNYAFLIYPLSREFETRLEGMLDKPVKYLLLADLRKSSIKQLWRILRDLNADHLLLPLEHDNIKLFLPILKILASVSSAKKILVISGDLCCTQYHKYKIAASIGALLIQSLRAFFAYWRCSSETANFLNKLPEFYPLTASRSVIYLDASIWYGTRTGGSVGHVTGVANALIGHGYSVDYAAEGRLPLLSPNIGFIKTTLPRLFTLPAELNLCWYNNQLIDELSKASAGRQFIYQRMSVENYSGVKLSKLLKIPLVIEYNGSLIWASAQWGNKLRFQKLAKQCETLCLHHAQLVVTISEVLKEELINLGVSAKKIICYPNCIDPVIFDPHRFTPTIKLALRSRLNIPQNSLIIAFIGTFGDWHGIDILASAIRQFIDRYPQYLHQFNIRFLLIGDGSKMPIVRNILGEKKYMEYVVLTGIISQETAPEYLAIADIFLSPHVNNRDGSRFFGSPTKLFEYMAMGKAIIASKLEQIAQVLHPSIHIDRLPQSLPSSNNAELALLCEPGNAEHIIAAILFLIQNPEWRKKLGENARNEVIYKYTWHNHVAAILDKLNSQWR